jgi:hypothetical protein
MDLLIQESDMATLLGSLFGGAGSSAGLTEAATQAINAGAEQAAGAAVSGTTGTGLFSSLLDLISKPTTGNVFGLSGKAGEIPIESSDEPRRRSETDIGSLLQLFLSKK